MSRASNEAKSSINSQTSTGAAHTYATNMIVGSAMAKALKYQHIAPAPPGRSSDNKTRKYMPRTTNLPYAVDQTQSVQRRNARERNRVKQVNNSFVRLRQHIPQSIITDLTKGGGRGPHKKISKVDTLRIAVEYIRRLQGVVDDLNGSGSSSEMESFNSLAGNSDAVSNSDTASNSSFSSSSSTSSAIDAQTQLYYTTVVDNGSSPTSFKPKDATSMQQPLEEHQQQQLVPSGLLTPVSLSSYSPQQAQLHIGCHSPTSPSFNSSMSSYESSHYDQPSSSTSTSLIQLTPPSLQYAGPHVNGAQTNDSGLVISSSPISSSNSLQTHLNAHLQLKFEPFENFNLNEEDCTPDDEEILDYISLWQEE